MPTVTEVNIEALSCATEKVEQILISVTAHTAAKHTTEELDEILLSVKHVQSALEAAYTLLRKELVSRKVSETAHFIFTDREGAATIDDHAGLAAHLQTAINMPIMEQFRNKVSVVSLSAASDKLFEKFAEQNPPKPEEFQHEYEARIRKLVHGNIAHFLLPSEKTGTVALMEKRKCVVKKAAKQA